MTGFASRRGTRFAGYSLAPEARAMRESASSWEEVPRWKSTMSSAARVAQSQPPRRHDLGGIQRRRNEVGHHWPRSRRAESGTRPTGSEIVKIDEPDEQSWHFVRLVPTASGSPGVAPRLHRRIRRGQRRAAAKFMIPINGVSRPGWRSISMAHRSPRPPETR